MNATHRRWHLLATTLCVLSAVFICAQLTYGQSSAGATLTREQFQNAIDRGLKYLYSTPAGEVFEESWKYHHHQYQFDHEFHHAIGNQALSLWAMLACGESYQNPALFRRMWFVLASDTSYVFDRGMRAQMLAELPRKRWAPYVHRDGLFLKGAVSDMGNFTRTYTGADIIGAGDNAHGQYGVLGLAGLQRAGWKGLKTDDWKKIDEYWRLAQQTNAPDENGAKDEPKGKTLTDQAGWGVFSFSEKHGSPAPQGIVDYTQVRGPMTAGAVAVLSNTERALYGNKMDVGKASLSPHLRRGLAWLDANFSLSDASEELDRYFYFFMVQSVGRYSGYRTFNGIDWFRQVSATLLHEQQANGAWTGPKGQLLSTSFALLYLARANDPLAIAKVRWGDSWNNRPHDIWNFVDYASDGYEVATTWQIAQLSQPVHELIESPILYLATDERFELSDPELARLRDYVQAGGLIVTNADGKKGPAQASFGKMAEQLFGERGFELKKVDKDHPIRHVHERDVHVPMLMVDNGIRPLMIDFLSDIGRDLQRNNTDTRAFGALSNIYLYATGMNPKRARLGNFHVVDQRRDPQLPLHAARIKHDGEYDPEPIALQQLKTILANDYDVDMKLATVTGAELSNQRIAFLTLVGELKMSDEQAASIRSWIERGGTLWLDVAGGRPDAISSVYALVDQLAQGAPRRRLDRRDRIISGAGLIDGHNCTRVNYRFFALKNMGTLVKPLLETAEIDGRPAIIFSTMDLTCGLAGLEHWGIFGYTPQWARRLVINGCLAALPTEE